MSKLSSEDVEVERMCVTKKGMCIIPFNLLKVAHKISEPEKMLVVYAKCGHTKKYAVAKFDEDTMKLQCGIMPFEKLTLLSKLQREYVICDEDTTNTTTSRNLKGCMAYLTEVGMSEEMWQQTMDSLDETN